jgi:hypothetical protein
MVVLIVTGLTVSMFGQEAQTTGLPDDWTHHHVLFSTPHPPGFEQAVKEGTLEKWLRLQNEPRLRLQQLKRNSVARAPVTTEILEDEEAAAARRPPANKTPTMKRDWSVSLGGAGVAPAQYPAKYTFNYTGAPSCANDFAVFPVNAAGNSSNQANIVGINNLYNSCSGGPTVEFAYYVGTGVVQTSPVLSLDGTKVAYVESASGASKLHVTTIGSGGGRGTSATSPAVPGTGNNGADTAKTICATSACSGGVSVTRSSVYYDYNTDSAYVGDDNGVLHKFTTVFHGTATEVTTSPWPLTVSSGAILTSPIKDPASGNIFVGDSNGNLNGVTSVGTLLGSYQVGAGGTYGGIVDAPIVDSITGYVFAAAGYSEAPIGNNPEMVQCTVNLATCNYYGLGGGSGIQGGQYGNVNNVHAGTFDNAYFSSVSTGHMYWCGISDAGNVPALFYVSFNSNGGISNTAGGLMTAVGFSALANGTNECSPLTEVYNTYSSTDWLFLSVGGNACGGATSSSTLGGCMMSFNIGSGTTGTPPSIGPWLPSTSYTSSQCGSSGSGRVEVVDTNGNLELCTNRGSGSSHESGTTTPAWTKTSGGTTSDNNLTWTNEGSSNGQTTAVQPTGTSGIVIDDVYNPPWTASTNYALGSLIVGVASGKGYVFECTTSGKSATTQPTWCSTTGCTVTESTGVEWTNEGANATANLYLGTLSGAGATKSAVKYTQAGLQ